MSTARHDQAPKTQHDITMLALKVAEISLAQGIQVQEEAQLDQGGTGLKSRLALIADYEGLQAKQDNHRRHRGSNQPVALIMADVDKFKSINDDYGHLTGDVVLKGVADVMRSSVRQRDIVARWGGEEFAMLLPRANRKAALRVAEGIRKNVATSNLMPGIENARPVTLSLGIAMVDLLEPLEFSAAKADLALYAAKHQGRDQVVFASELPKIPKLQDIELVPALNHRKE